MSEESPGVSRSAEPCPEEGIQGLRVGWKEDAVAGFLVFLIALPLCLGISIASGFPPIAGVLTAILGGLAGPLLGSAHLTIKGPAAGLIVIVAGAVAELGAGDAAMGYRRALAVGVVAAALQVGMALAKAGTLADLFPSSVLHGMLAAIGITITARQVHVMLGVKPEHSEPLQLLAEIPHSLMHADVPIAVIGALSLAILVAAPRLPWALWRRVPPPLLVLAMAVPFGLALGLHAEHDVVVGDLHWRVGPSFLVTLPPSMLAAVTFPDFSVITSMTSIKYIVLFSVIGTIESLLSAKAVETLDPWRRRSDMNRDLLAVGVANLAAATVGGLPMISEIVRSSANVASGARTRWANFFHGLTMLLFVALLPGLIQEIPLAALAAMLVYTGLRLASPAEFRHTWRIGWDQLTVFMVTCIVTLATDLLVGVAVGIATKVALHLWHGAPLSKMFRPEVEVTDDADGSRLKISGAAVFTGLLPIAAAVRRAATRARVVEVDLSAAKVVDHTLLSRLADLEAELKDTGVTLVVLGLDLHRPLSPHPLAGRRIRGA